MAIALASCAALEALGRARSQLAMRIGFEPRCRGRDLGRALFWFFFALVRSCLPPVGQAARSYYHATSLPMLRLLLVTRPREIPAGAVQQRRASPIWAAAVVLWAAAAALWPPVPPAAS